MSPMSSQHQHRCRWLNQLNPNVKKGPFTPEEDRNILALHKMYGNKWATIAKNLPGRWVDLDPNRWLSLPTSRQHGAVHLLSKSSTCK